MKHYILSVFAALTLFISCSKSNNNNGGGNSNLSSKPEAKAAYDKSNFGMYKGVFVGSTGYIIVDINNSSSISATLVIDGEKRIFTPRSSTLTEGTSINSLTFVNGSDSFVFSVDADGANPRVSSINIAGHNGATILIVKETSTSLVKCMEGTYSGDENGTWNGAVQGNTFKGLALNPLRGRTYTGTGTLDASNNLTGITDDNRIKFSGNLRGDSGSGTWQNAFIESASSGTWKVTRTY
jgi:hypothetical protein